MHGLCLRVNKSKDRISDIMYQQSELTVTLADPLPGPSPSRGGGGGGGGEGTRSAPYPVSANPESAKVHTEYMYMPPCCKTPCGVVQIPGAVAEREHSTTVCPPYKHTTL